MCVFLASGVCVCVCVRAFFTRELRVWCGVVRCGPVCMRLPITARARSFPQSGRAPRARGREGGPGGGGSVLGGGWGVNEKRRPWFSTHPARRTDLCSERECAGPCQRAEKGQGARAPPCCLHTLTLARSHPRVVFSHPKKTLVSFLSLLFALFTSAPSRSWPQTSRPSPAGPPPWA